MFAVILRECRVEDPDVMIVHRDGGVFSSFHAVHDAKTIVDEVWVDGVLVWDQNAECGALEIVDHEHDAIWASNAVAHTEVDLVPSQWLQVAPDGTPVAFEWLSSVDLEDLR